MKSRILRWLLAIGSWAFCVYQFRALFNSGGGIPSQFLSEYADGDWVWNAPPGPKPR